MKAGARALAIRGVFVCVLASTTFAGPVLAQLSGGATAGASAPSAGTASLEGRTNEAHSNSSTSDDSRADEDWTPASQWELGAFIGPVFISDNNSFRDLAFDGPSSEADIRAFSKFKKPAIEFGLRGGYFPLTFLGTELEGLLISSETNGSDVATILGARAHIVAQLPGWRIVPFLLGGFGFWNVRNSASGDDVDPAFHYGGGAKLYLTHDLIVRVDIRDSITNRRGDAPYPHSLEVLGGAALALGRAASAPEEVERASTFSEECPPVVMVAPQASPLIDSDSDGTPDRDDACPADRGMTPSGCPDADADGFPDRTDSCPSIAGVAPDGCPADPDGDGILRSDDRCPNLPETRNGFEDSDGCPDELPLTVQRCIGTLGGIEFDLDQASIRPGAERLLAKVAAMLAEYPDVNIEIIGHTDSDGARQYNLELSQRRADAVRDYLVAQGIASERLHPSGEGPDAPIASNNTLEGRQANRRIEFHIIE